MFNTVNYLTEFIENNRNMTIGQIITSLLNYLTENNISPYWFIFEVTLYLVKELLMYIWLIIYNYILNSFDRPFRTIQDIYEHISHISFASIPKKYRWQIYKIWVKRLIVDIIRFAFVFYLLYKIQLHLIWKTYK
jgi:hypothetical protein